MNYHQSGSIRLAHTKERVQEFERAMSMARYQGIPMEMWTPEEAKERFAEAAENFEVPSVTALMSGRLDFGEMGEALKDLLSSYDNLIAHLGNSELNRCYAQEASHG